MKNFQNRNQAGKLLAEKLVKYKNKKNAIVLAIPRGGVVVGYEIAKTLKLKLDLIVTKKLGYPGNSEYAIGAVAPGKKMILDEVVISTHGISKKYIEEESNEIYEEIKRRYKEYRGEKDLPSLKNKVVIIVDDGIATGYTTRAAIKYVKSENAKKIILAVPVIPCDTFESLKKEVDEIICLNIAEMFFAISQFYSEFPQLDDTDVRGYLSNAE